MSRLFTVIIANLFLYIFISLSYAYEGVFNERKRVINKTLDQIELSLEYIFAAQGRQTFEVVDSQERRISRLEYPHRGGILIFKGEVGFWSKFSLDGRFGSSFFKKRTAIDQDWLPPIEDVWLESESRCKPVVEFYDFNLYFRLLELNEDKIRQIRLSSEESTIFDYLMVDSLSFDIFAGYQQQKGRYPMTEGVTTISWWVPVYSPFSGLDSFYKIRYKGPRLGLRAEGSKGKVTTRVSLAYSWLRTKAYGWWNLRDYSFWQSGTRGYGIDIGLEVTYALTPSFSAGLGFNYFYLRQRKLKETGVFYSNPANNYNDLDIIRNANCKIYGPSFILKYNW